MGWNHEPEEVKILPKEELLKRETTWYSSYNEPDRWKKDLKECYYVLTGEYELDKNLILLRFELNEVHRKDLAVNAPHFQNVIIKTDLPQVVLSDTMLNMHKKR